MKKFTCLFLSLVLMLSGCAGTPEEATSPPTTQTPAAETTLPTESPGTALDDLRANLPVMDGSTSLIPLEAGIRAALFGKSIEEATADVSHTTTWDSYYNLLHGTADLIFSVPLSAEQWAMADERGVTLETVPIAKEGFVFVVNAENPVDTLTQQQIKDIYSGKITNWSEVGGLDEEIVPYQRNRDSGSQNYMIEFMGDTPLMDAPTELRPATMAGLMDVIAVNDNSRAAIGYSVYAYAADMYGNGNEIKFIQVDGVAPSKQTFADGSYPLMGYNYAVYRTDIVENPRVRQLVDWMLTPEGQTAIASAGYVTVVDVGYDYAEEILTKYEGIGTGPAAPEKRASYEYALWTVQGYIQHLAPEVLMLSDGTGTYRLTQLTDKTLLAEVNAWIDEQMIWAYEVSESITHPLGLDYPYDNCYTDQIPAGVIATCTNGYLSVAFPVASNHNAVERFYRTETATWDLLTGERLAPEELFCQGVDIDLVLNNFLLEYSQTGVSSYGIQEVSYPELSRDFAGLPSDGTWHLTHDAIYFDVGNPYFPNGLRLELDKLPDGTLVCEQPRDFTDCIDSPDYLVMKQFWTSDRDTEYILAGGSVPMRVLSEDVSPYAARINRQMEEYVAAYFTREAICDYFESNGMDPARIEFNSLDWSMTNWGGRYATFSGSPQSWWNENGTGYVMYPLKADFLFDLTTGEEISWKDMLLPGWEEASTLQLAYSFEDAPDTMPGISDLGKLKFCYINQHNEHTFYLGFQDADGTNYHLIIPWEYVKF